MSSYPTPIRNLLTAKVQAALQANSSPLLTDITHIPTALSSSKVYHLPLTCTRTGLTIGSLTLATVAGHMPVVGQWRDSMVLHPLFSLSHSALLSFAKNTWFRFCAFDTDEAEDEKLTRKQEETLQAVALALIYKLTEVRQDIPWMPDWQDVAANWTSLLAISYWKAYLDSARFNFPHIHLSQVEGTFYLKDYLQSCWKVKKEYEHTVNEKIEIEKLAAAEAATLALREELVGTRPTSNRQVWRWFLAHLPRRYQKDSEEWMRDLFFARGEEITKYRLADLELFERIFVTEIPLGTSASHAFSEILSSKRKYLQETIEAYEIILPAAMVNKQAAPAAEPQLKDYKGDTAGWMKARAEWRLARMNLKGRQERIVERQATATVSPSFIPELPSFLVDSSEQELEEFDQQLDAAEAADRDDNITGDLEE